MSRSELTARIKQRQTFLIVGLDTDVRNIPAILQSSANGVAVFNQAIIEATSDYCIGYKINLAFYEAMGVKGWEAVEQTLQAIPPGHLVIADAKRGDIGNTSHQYARAFFETFRFDAITVNPYMGEDSVLPFLSYPGKWVIILLLTSNKGSADFQLLRSDGRYLYEIVAEKTAAWGSPDNLMYVVGATHPDQFGAIRNLLPDHFLLVPGVGAQGGDLQTICLHGFNKQGGVLVNVSRSIIYASKEKDFAQKAADTARSLQQQMAQLLREHHII